MLIRFVKGLEGHKDQRVVKAALDSCFHEVKRVAWKSPADIKGSYANASITDTERVVFNIKPPQEHRLDILTTLGEAFEEAHFPIDMPDSN